MAFLRRRDPDPYFTEEPVGDPVVIVRPGGALVDPAWLAQENIRANAEQERLAAKAKADRDLQEQDAERARVDAESMAQFYDERMQTELPEHLRRGRADDA